MLFGRMETGMAGKRGMGDERRTEERTKGRK